MLGISQLHHRRDPKKVMWGPKLIQEAQRRAWLTNLHFSGFQLQVNGFTVDHRRLMHISKKNALLGFFSFSFVLLWIAAAAASTRLFKCFSWFLISLWAQKKIRWTMYELYEDWCWSNWITFKKSSVST